MNPVAKKKKIQALRRLSQSRKKPLLSPRALKPEGNPFLSALASSSSSHQPEDIYQWSPKHTKFFPQTKKFTYPISRTNIGSHDIRSHDPRETAEIIPETSNRSLHLKGVPDIFNNDNDLLSHFSKFGPVESIRSDGSKKCADVHYRTREGAIAAKKQGTILSREHPPIAIFWYSKKVPSSNHGNSKNIQSSSTKMYDSDYNPSMSDNSDNSDNENDEGVNEGVDSVLYERSNDPNDDVAMDTIARSVSHPYYLRSLHQPEKDLVKDTISSYERYCIPVSSLQAPPIPQGSSAIKCFTALDERDSHIRKSLKKDTSLMAQIIIGTCPDMCPEKERYERDYQRRLSILETLPEGGVDHTRAIKEYSRSAADKDEPLSHELRPLPVLLMTMDYICTCIINKLSEYPDCYHFIWDRTRAITTDITYQQLCDLDCALITERCARFHILSAYVLCEEELKTFDPKMNHESLARHLHSLRQIYNDLKTNKEIVIANEQEMCCYDILLHVNDGNVLNKIEGYSNSVRQSKQVTFAVSVVQAIESDNFVRFFKLVRRADFLSACILHKYFDKIRLKALKTLNASHSPGLDKPMHFSLTDLSRMLGFIDKDEAATFCHEVGLHVTRENVLLLRGHEVSLPNGGSLRKDSIVSGKNTKSLSEVVYGGPLPPVPNHTPYCSFGTNPQVSHVVAMTTTKQYDDQEIQLIVNDIIDEVIDNELAAASGLIINKSLADSIFKSVTDAIADVIITETITKISKETSQQIILEELNERNRQQQQKLLITASEEICQLSFEEVIHEMCCGIAVESINDAMAYNQLIYDCAAGETLLIVEAVLTESIHSITVDCIKTAHEDRDQRLAALSNIARLRKLKMLWNRWVKIFHVHQHIKDSVSHFPPVGPRITLDRQLNNMITATMATQHMVDCDPFVMAEEYLSQYRKTWNRSLEPIDIKTLLLAHLPLSVVHSTGKRPVIFWDLLIMCHSINEMTLLWAWLQNKMKVPKISNDGNDFIIPKISVQFSSSEQLTENQMKTPTVAMMVVPMPLINDNINSYTDGVMMSLSLLSATTPTVILTPYKLPLVNEIHLLKAIEANSYNCTISNLSFNEENLINSLKWLIQNTVITTLVQWRDVHQYLYEGLSEEFYQPVSLEMKSSLINQNPEVIIEFFNDVLDDYIDLIKRGVVSVIPESDVQNIPVSSWRCPINNSELSLMLSDIKLIQLNNSTCHEYIDRFPTDITSKSRLYSLLHSNDSVVPWVHVLLICTELLLDTCRFLPYKVGVPLGYDSHTPHLTLNWVQLVSESRSQVTRKRRLSEPSNATSEPVRYKTSRLSVGSLETQPLSLAINKELLLQADFETSLRQWLVADNIPSQSYTEEQWPTDGIPNIDDDSETNDTQNEKWKNIVTTMKLSVLQTSYVNN